jgi:hypothetical protein
MADQVSEELGPDSAGLDPQELRVQPAPGVGLQVVLLL